MECGGDHVGSRRSGMPLGHEEASYTSEPSAHATTTVNNWLSHFGCELQPSLGIVGCRGQGPLQDQLWAGTPEYLSI